MERTPQKKNAPQPLGGASCLVHATNTRTGRGGATRGRCKHHRRAQRGACAARWADGSQQGGSCARLPGVGVASRLYVRPSSAQPRAVRDTFPCTIAPRDCGVRVLGASGGPAAVGGWAPREGECGVTTGDGGCCGGSALREKSAAPHAFSYRVVPHMTPAATHGRPQTDVQSECAAQEATGLPLTTLCQLQTFCTPCSR